MNKIIEIHYRALTKNESELLKASQVIHVNVPRGYKKIMEKICAENKTDVRAIYIGKGEESKKAIYYWSFLCKNEQSAKKLLGCLKCLCEERNHE